ncbi:hypothetical protein ISU10_15395 [Nocardioides agariphilus]|jgi:hypothetical protein|uniref:Uncharacterized protein n=1 Tax=Nocardioides agariphilus TaxID=433664 RepID=A0A930YJD0_9ACTN|nr:hypothetical protein [Nocardioides agariphilus]MBF4769152.1 hypothetical protein [Nocardioides agariphilus]
MLLKRARTAVAVLVTAAAGGALSLGSPGPAEAATCQTASGVSVVVEPGGLGGGVQVACISSGGGRSADRLLKDAGHTLTYVQRFPGFVCRIDGLPADDPCVNTPPADAYWGLWWSDGKSGTWSYSSLGASSLEIPAGGYLAMVWDGSSGGVRPQTDPSPHRQASPTPTPTPTKKPTSQAPDPTATPTSVATSSQPPDSPSSSPTPSTTKRPKPTTTATATPEPSDPTTPASEEQTEAGAPVDGSVEAEPQSDDDGLPPWVAPVAVVVLLGAAGAVALVRRRSSP